jgi:hypothetical protein
LKVMRDGRPVTVEVTADGAGLVSHAGSALLAQVADRLGFTRALSLPLPVLKQRRRGHDPGRVIRDLAVMLADGGECVSDLGAPSPSARPRRGPNPRRQGHRTGQAPVQSVRAQPSVVGNRGARARAASGPRRCCSTASSPRPNRNDCATDYFTSPPASRSPDDAASCISNAPGPGQPSSPQPSGDSKRSQSLPADRSRRTTPTTTQDRGCRRDHACPPTIPNGRPRLRQSASDHARHPTTPQSPRVTVKTSARPYP